MCGIAGTTQPTQDRLKAFCTAMEHRGPDAQGTWMDPDGTLGLAHTRLKIIDLTEGGAQPMVSPCGRYALTYNGEIYNYQDVKADLEAVGIAFRSESDTEVLLAALIHWGEEALVRLVGMFAFAFWDREAGSLLLARDRFGIKPLVYAPLPDGGLAFASEIAALKTHPGINLEPDREALSAYLACLYVPVPLTMHRGIRKMPPGHLLRWQNNNIEVKPYWQPAYAPDRIPSMKEAIEELTPLVEQAVKGCLVSDVPVGCFLSGGIDSSVISAIAAKSGPTRTFTMTFDEPRYDERETARLVANHIGSVHTELPGRSNLADLLDDSLDGFGEPFGNPTSLLIHDLSRKAREHVTVALVGDGGDEVFGGYPRYSGGLLARRYRMIPKWMRKGLIEPAARLIPESHSGRHSLRRARSFIESAGLKDAEMYADWVEYFGPTERQALLGLDSRPGRPIAELYRAAPSPHPLDAMQQTDLMSFLPGNLLAYGDAMSMRHALELRLPLLDHRLAEAVGRIAPDIRLQGGLKGLLKGVAANVLPGEIINAPKRGFNPPLGLWLRQDLKDWIPERLTAERLEPLGLNWSAVKALLDTHSSGRRDVALKVWALIVYERWARG
ncbi:MAG: asparagine synthase (glutamine-hydrolyzing) [Magnetovibrionaceae bacterium]